MTTLHRGLQFLAVIATLAFASVVQAQVPVTLVPAGSTWRYLDNGSDQGTNWVGTTFDDSGWKSGPAKLGYNDGAITVVEDNPTPGYEPTAVNRFITTYFRHSFVVTNSQSLSSLRVALLRDDGAAVFLNGREVFRSNLPGGQIDYLTRA